MIDKSQKEKFKNMIDLIKISELTIVADYGHGFINKEIGELQTFKKSELKCSIKRSNIDIIPKEEKFQ